MRNIEAFLVVFLVSVVVFVVVEAVSPGTLFSPLFRFLDRLF